MVTWCSISGSRARLSMGCALCNRGAVGCIVCGNDPLCNRPSSRLSCFHSRWRWQRHLVLSHPASGFWRCRSLCCVCSRGSRCRPLRISALSSTSPRCHTNSGMGDRSNRQCFDGGSAVHRASHPHAAAASGRSRVWNLCRRLCQRRSQSLEKGDRGYYLTSTVPCNSMENRNRVELGRVAQVGGPSPSLKVGCFCPVENNSVRSTEGPWPAGRMRSTAAFGIACR